MTRSVTHRKSLLVALPLLALVSFGSAASAQIVVNVDLRNARILNNVARDLDVAVNNVPITVQAPINIAAQVCNISANILSTAYNRGNASCYAQQTNTAFNNIVQDVINLQSGFAANRNRKTR